MKEESQHRVEHQILKHHTWEADSEVRKYSTEDQKNEKILPRDYKLMKIIPRISILGHWDTDYKEQQKEESFRKPKAYF